MLRFTVLALILSVAAGLELSASLHDHWTKFKSTHNKEYSSEEEQQRKEIFKQNVEKVLNHNLNADLGEHSHRLSINEFADMTHEEFKSKMLGLRLDLANFTNSGLSVSPAELSAVDIPESKDWTSYMGPIKNQGECGSCWTFATTGAIEGHWAIYKGEKVTLSEQNLLDCSTSRKYRNYGCDGGLPMNAMNYIMDNGGIDSDTCYKYEEKVGTCRYKSSCRAATISNFALVRFESVLRNVVGLKGPVTIGIDAGQDDFQLLGDGIYDTPSCSQTPNHAVVAVGYGSENGQDYWIVKNSWGTSWGNKGYFRMARGSNLCGIANLASYPVI